MNDKEFNVVMFGCVVAELWAGYVFDVMYFSSILAAGLCVLWYCGAKHV